MEAMTEELYRDMEFHRVWKTRISINVFIDKIYDKDEKGNKLSLMRRGFAVKANYKPFDEFLEGTIFKLHSTEWGKYELPQLNDWVTLRFPYYGKGKEEDFFHKGILCPSEESKKIEATDFSYIKNNDVLPFCTDSKITLKDYTIEELIEELKARGCKGRISFTTNYSI